MVVPHAFLLPVWKLVVGFFLYKLNFTSHFKITKKHKTFYRFFKKKLFQIVFFFVDSVRYIGVAGSEVYRGRHVHNTCLFARKQRRKFSSKKQEILLYGEIVNLGTTNWWTATFLMMQCSQKNPDASSGYVRRYFYTLLMIFKIVFHIFGSG